MNQTVLLPSENVICRKIADETFLVPIQGNLANMRKIFALDAVGEFVWRRLDGKNSLEDIHEEIFNAFEVSRERAWKDLLRFKDELIREKLIAETA